MFSYTVFVILSALILETSTLKDAKVPKDGKIEEKAVGTRTMYRKSVSQPEAMGICETNNKRLAVFLTVEDAQAFVGDLRKASEIPEAPADPAVEEVNIELGLSRRYWIGLTDMVREGNWVWLKDGSELTYEDMWTGGQPDHYNGGSDKNEHCVVLWNPNFLNKTDTNPEPKHSFNDENCGNKHYFICEDIPADANKPPVKPQGRSFGKVVEDEEGEDSDMPYGVTMDDGRKAPAGMAGRTFGADIVEPGAPAEDLKENEDEEEETKPETQDEPVASKADEKEDGDSAAPGEKVEGNADEEEKIPATNDELDPNEEGKAKPGSDSSAPGEKLEEENPEDKEDKPIANGETAENEPGMNEQAEGAGSNTSAEKVDANAEEQENLPATQDESGSDTPPSKADHATEEGDSSGPGEKPEEKLEENPEDKPATHDSDSSAPGEKPEENPEDKSPTQEGDTIAPGEKLEENTEEKPEDKPPTHDSNSNAPGEKLEEKPEETSAMKSELDENVASNADETAAVTEPSAPTEHAQEENPAEHEDKATTSGVESNSDNPSDADHEKSKTEQVEEAEVNSEVPKEPEAEVEQNPDETPASPGEIPVAEGEEAEKTVESRKVKKRLPSSTSPTTNQPTVIVIGSPSKTAAKKRQSSKTTAAKGQLSKPVKRTRPRPQAQRKDTARLLAQKSSGKVRSSSPQPLHVPAKATNASSVPAKRARNSKVRDVTLPTTTPVPTTVPSQQPVAVAKNVRSGAPVKRGPPKRLLQQQLRKVNI